MLKTLMNIERIFALARYILGGFMILSGVGKIIDSTAAVEAVRYIFSDYQSALPLTPQALTITISVLEILAGAVFFWGRYLYVGLFGAAVSLLMFTVPLVEVVFKGKSVAACGCSGLFDAGMSLPMLLVRNGILYAILLWMTFVIQYRKVEYSKHLPPQKTLLDALMKKKND
jgi:hypothetical protein